MIRRDPLFKGCTRPPMLFGVPLTPLVVVTVVHAALAIWFTLLFLIGLPVAIVIMRLIVRSDEQQFRLLGLRLQCRLRNGNRQFWGGGASYSPLSFTRRRW